MLVCAPPNLGRARIDHGAMRFVDAAGLSPSIALVPTGQRISDRARNAAQITRARDTRALADDSGTPLARLAAYLADSWKPEVAGE